MQGSGPVRNMWLPAGTLRVKGEAVCATLKSMPFEPCFSLNRTDDKSFRGAVSGMGFAYCDFQHQGAAQMLMARAVDSSQLDGKPALWIGGTANRNREAFEARFQRLVEEIQSQLKVEHAPGVEEHETAMVGK